MKKYNVGIVGYGWVATAHIPAINATRLGQVTAVCSSRKLDAAALSTQYGGPISVYNDLDQMLADPDIHVVSLCGFPTQRLDQVIRAARAGKQLILEKPLCLSLKDLRAMHPSVKILVVSMQEESLYAERVLRAGAQGYITKQEATRNVLLAIRQVRAGEVYVSSAIANKIASTLVGHQRVGSEGGVATLADRELQVFELIGDGFNTREIADQLHLEVKTIETYRARIKEKLRLRDSSELLRNAIAWTHRHS